MTHDDIPEALGLQEKGWTLEEIGIYFDVGTMRVWRLLKGHPDYKPQRTGCKPTIDSKQVVDLYERGFTPNQICHLLGKSKPTVHRAFWREGIRFYGPDGVGRSKG